MAITLSAFCLAILVVSILGGLLPLATVFNHTRLQVYLSFSAGTMLGAAFFHMMPEAVRVGSVATIPWAAFGLLAPVLPRTIFLISPPRAARTVPPRSITTITAMSTRPTIGHDSCGASDSASGSKAT